MLPVTPLEKTLFFEERNAHEPESIIFLHGGGGSHIEWKAVAAQETLASHHLILVDLPGHSESRNIGPFSLEKAADEVHTVIQNHAHGGKAHVVGFSLGGFVALSLTVRYSSVVRSTFVTGSYPYKGLFKWAIARPAVMRVINSFESIPGLTGLGLRMQGIDGEEWLVETKKNKGWGRGGAVMRELSYFSTEDVQAVADSGVRTCVIAGGKMDQVDAIKEMGSLLRERGQKKGLQNDAFVVQKAYHPWHLQFPALFAAGVEAWVRGTELPRDFVVI